MSQRELENKKILERIKHIHKESRGSYGSPRITQELHKENLIVSRPRVARLMRKNKICAKTKRKFKVTTNSDHRLPISPNLLQQNFTVNQPNKVWVSDITYIPTRKGWLYLTVIIDLYNRQVVGWAMSNNLHASSTTIPALKHAYHRFCPSTDLIFHSDRGVQYACKEFRKMLALFQMIQSMSGKANCYDNAVAESFFSTLKKELIYHHTYETRLIAKQSIFEYIEIFYNRKRIHSFLGNMSPVQFLKFNKAA